MDLLTILNYMYGTPGIELVSIYVDTPYSSISYDKDLQVMSSFLNEWSIQLHEYNVPMFGY